MADRDEFCELHQPRSVISIGEEGWSDFVPLAAFERPCPKCGRPYDVDLTSGHLDADGSASIGLRCPNDGVQSAYYWAWEAPEWDEESEADERGDPSKVEPAPAGKEG